LIANCTLWAWEKSCDAEAREPRLRPLDRSALTGEGAVGSDPVRPRGALRSITMTDEQESTTAEEGDDGPATGTAAAGGAKPREVGGEDAGDSGEGQGSEAGEGPDADAAPAVIRHEDRPDAPIPIDPGFRLELPGFEGPLDLLLFLIRKHELDILDLPIAFICEKYAEYITLMEHLNLDVASEYLVMAATLAHIKSKELLPRVPEEQDDDDEDEVDPRAELIRRLLEYQKYKRAAEQLGAFGVAGRDVFPRGIPAPKAEGPAPLAEISVFKLIDAFQRIVKRREGEISLEVDAERVTIQERMSQITEALQQRERLSFEELFEGYATTYDLVVTFLALLEMAKSRLTRIYQSEPEGPIYLEARVLKVDDHGPGDEPTPDTLTGAAAAGAAYPSDGTKGLAQSLGAAEGTEEEDEEGGAASTSDAAQGLAQSHGATEGTQGEEQGEAGFRESGSEADIGSRESGSVSEVGSRESESEAVAGSDSGAEGDEPLDSAGRADQDADGR